MMNSKGIEEDLALEESRIPVIIGVLGAVTKTFERTKKPLELKTSLDQFQKTALLGTA